MAEKLNNFFGGRVKISTILLLIFFVMIAVRPVNDPDFGWHLKFGEYFAINGWVPKTDIFSYTNPEYPFINNASLNDLSLYFLYVLGGRSTIFINILFLALAVLTFVYLLPKTAVDDPGLENYANKTLEDKLLIGIMAFLITSPLFFINPIVYDYLGFILVMIILERYKISGNKKILWFMPLVFFIWSWLHGGFPIGIALVGLMIFADAIEICARSANRLMDLKKELAFPMAMLAISVAATMLNPYGFGFYGDVLNVFRGSDLVSRVEYWQPTYLRDASFPYYIYLLCFFLFLVFSKTVPALRHVLYIAFFSSFGFLAFRLYPFFIFSTTPVLSGMDRKNRINVLLILFAILLTALINTAVYRKPSFSFFWPGREIINDFVSEKEIFYRGFPEKALFFIKENRISGRVFNEFSWGGQLTWSLPEQRVFISGNMPHWEDGNGHKIFEDYFAIRELKSGWIQLIQDYYKIDWFFIESDSPIISALELMPDKWERVYKDDRAAIFVKR